MMVLDRPPNLAPWSALAPLMMADADALATRTVVPMASIYRMALAAGLADLAASADAADAGSITIGAALEGAA